MARKPVFINAVVSLPMRDGNSPSDMAKWLDIGC